jgi:hypothetical protein
VQRLPPSSLSRRLLVGAACVLMARQARAVDPFEIQVYDATINQPGAPGIELHVNSILSGLRTAVPPELPPDHQTHFTLEPSLGLTRWWELGGYLQFALRADGNFDYAGVKLRSKLVHSPTTDNPFGVGINLEISRLPDSYDRDRWGAEIRPIATATVGGDRLFFSANPIVDLGLAGPAASVAPSFEPAATALYVVGGLCSLGLEYYANLGPIGSWLPANQQEHYLYEVANVLRWRRWEINLGVGEGLTDGSNRLVAKTIVGFR